MVDDSFSLFCMIARRECAVLSLQDISDLTNCEALVKSPILFDSIVYSHSRPSTRRV